MDTDRSNSFGPDSRIKKRRQFLELQTKAEKLFSKHFLILIAENLVGTSRLGVTITRKVDKRATMRNLLKRRLREVFRLNRYKLRGNFDIVIVARKNAAECSYSEVVREVLGALHYHKFLKKG